MICKDCADVALVKERCRACYSKHRYRTKVKTDPVAMQVARERKRARRLDPRTKMIDNHCDMRNCLREYGLTFEAYCDLLTQQANVCAICLGVDEDKRLAVDHCHATGRVRGLLCQNCNHGVGKFKDSPARLRCAADYLERDPPTLPPLTPWRKRGQQPGARSNHARLTDAQVREIRASARGTTFEFASCDIVSRIKRGLIYRHVL